MKWNKGFDRSFLKAELPKDAKQMRWRQGEMLWDTVDLRKVLLGWVKTLYDWQIAKPEGSVAWITCNYLVSSDCCVVIWSYEPIDNLGSLDISWTTVQKKNKDHEVTFYYSHKLPCWVPCSGSVPPWKHCPEIPRRLGAIYVKEIWGKKCIKYKIYYTIILIHIYIIYEHLSNIVWGIPCDSMNVFLCLVCYCHRFCMPWKLPVTPSSHPIICRLQVIRHEVRFWCEPQSQLSLDRPQRTTVCLTPQVLEP